jgi:predicted porin
MQKKLIAVAIAGALGTPAAVLAQTSTVNIYGNITFEYGLGDQGAGKKDVDYADTPGGSAIGFRGEEKLGGGLSAWFQCESSADVRGIDQTGFCTRNSAVGFRGAWGNLHFGRWDTPFKRALNVGTVGAEETGLMGMSFLPFGGSGGADATGTGPDSVNRQRWKRREVGLSYYETPVFGGFQGLFAFSPGNHAADGSDARAALFADPSLDISTNSKPRVISLSGTYMAGPLGIGIGYEVHQRFGAYSPASCCGSADDRAWGISAAYTFAGRVKVGATYLDAKYETGAGLPPGAIFDLKKKTATIGVEWNIAGPHELHAQYAWADDSKGNSPVGIGGNGGAEASGGGTGGQAWTIGYRYNFSKRTWVKVAYVMVDNDGNSNSYRIGNTSSLLFNGEKVDSLAFRIGHRF